MANTYTDYTSVAAQTDFAINFDYLEDYHVIVNIDGTDYDVNSSGGSYTFTIVTSPTKQVVISPALSAGQKVRVYRNTRGIDNDQVGRLVDFSDGSVIKADDLDTTYLHNLYLAQEASEDPVSTVNAEDGAILTWNATNGRWEVSGTGAVANAVLAYNSSTNKWDVIPLNLQYDSGNGTFGFGGTPATDYAHKFYGDLLVRQDGTSNGAVLTVENTDATNTNAVLILTSRTPIIQLLDVTGVLADDKWIDIALDAGVLSFLPYHDRSSPTAQSIPLKLSTSGGVIMPSLPTSDPSVTGEVWNSGGFIVLSGTQAIINSLVDVDTTGVAGLKILKYNAVTSKWEAGNIDELDELGDVSVAGASNKDLLEYDGSEWTNVDRYIYDSGWTTTWNGTTIDAQVEDTVTLNAAQDAYFPFSIHVWFRSSSAATAVFPIAITPDSGSTSSTGVQVQYDTTSRGLKLTFQDRPYYYESATAGVPITATWNAGTGQIRVVITR